MTKRSLNVLLVDNDPESCRLVERALACSDEAVGFSVDSAPDLKTARQYLGCKDFDCMLLDIQLPDSKGIDTLVQIRKITPNTPVVILSAVSDSQTCMQAIRYGADYYLVKGRFMREMLSRSICFSIIRSNTRPVLVQENDEKVKKVQAELGGKIEELNSEVQRLGADRQKLMSEVHKVISEREQLVYEVEKFNAESKQLSSEVAAATKERNRLRIEASEAKADCEKYKSEVQKVNTEREQLRNHISKLKKQFDGIFNSIPSMIWLRDPEGNIVVSNKKARQFFYESIRSVDNNEPEKVFTEVLGLSKDDDQFIFASGCPLPTRYVEYVNESGTKLNLEVDRVPYTDEQGGIIGILVYVKELPEKVEADKQQEVVESLGVVEDSISALEALVSESVKGEVAEVEANTRLESVPQVEPEREVKVEQVEMPGTSMMIEEESRSEEVVAEVIRPRTETPVIDEQQQSSRSGGEELHDDDEVIIIDDCKSKSQSVHQNQDKSQHQDRNQIQSKRESKKEVSPAQKVLIVEDDPLCQMLMNLHLNSLGIDIVTVDNGQKAVDIVGQEEFDLILMDIRMPVMNGNKAAAQIRKMGIKTPILAITSFVAGDMRQQCLDAGCNDFICKPIIKKEFYNIVSTYLEVSIPGFKNRDRATKEEQICVEI